MKTCTKNIEEVYTKYLTKIPSDNIAKGFDYNFYDEEDIAQDIAVKLLEKNAKQNLVAPYAFAKKILDDKKVDNIKKKIVRQKKKDKIESMNIWAQRNYPITIPEHYINLVSLLDAIGALPKTLSSVLLLKSEGYSFDEISNIISEKEGKPITKPGIISRFKTARKKLAELLPQ